MRRTAERVDEQLLTQMQAHAIPGPWAAGERVLVCVSEDPRAAGLVRYAKRLADRLHGPWTALYVETARSLQLGEEERDRIADTLRLAVALGGEAVTIPGGHRHVADDVIGYAHEQQRHPDHHREIDALAMVRDPARLGRARSGAPGRKHQRSRHRRRRGRRRGRPQEDGAHGGGIRAVRCASLSASRSSPLRSRSASASLIHPWFGIENVDLVFLTAIVAVAVRFGLWPSLFASVVASLCYNFFFMPPLYTFTIADPNNVAAFVFFITMAAVVSNVAARVRTQAMAAMGRARTTESLYAFSRKLAGVGTLDDVLWATAYQIALMLKVRVVLLLPEGGSLVVKTGYPPEDMLADADIAAAKWAWENNRPAGRGSDTLPGAKWLFLPMRTGRGAIGVIGIDSDKPGPLLTPDERRLLDALIDQGALAIERVNLVEDMDRVQRTVETERLRSALLTSISHDLKTPLAGVLGAAGTLRDFSEQSHRCAKGRAARDDHRRIGAAQPVHRQPARHDQAGVRRRGAQYRAA